jgi:hypothetical protein
MSTEKKLVIGSANLSYDENGILETATFYPKIQISKDDIEKEIGDCNNKTIEDVRKCAELLLAAFFAQISDIELRNTETTDIIAETQAGEKYESGSLKNIQLDFIYKQK